MLDLYKNIKAKRLEKGWSQTELAKQVGYSDKSMIAKIEAGKVDLSQTKIRRFAQVFGCTESELMGWRDEETILNANSEILAESRTLLDITNFLVEYENYYDKELNERQKQSIDRILEYVGRLTLEGLEEAEKRVEELSQLDKYKRGK